MKINLHTNENHTKPQFNTKRIYKNITYNSLITLLDENKNRKIQSIFNSEHPEYIADTLLKELNKAVNKLLIKKKTQKKKHETVYRTKLLESQRQQIRYLDRMFHENKTHENERALKHAKNRHSREMKKQEKLYYTNNYKCTLSKWKKLKEETDQEG